LTLKSESARHKFLCERDERMNELKRQIAYVLLCAVSNVCCVLCHMCCVLRLRSFLLSAVSSAECIYADVSTGGAYVYVYWVVQCTARCCSGATAPNESVADTVLTDAGTAHRTVSIGMCCISAVHVCCLFSCVPCYVTCLCYNLCLYLIACRGIQLVEYTERRALERILTERGLHV